MYFYELHESDDELFSEALLAHDSEYDENEFLELVQEARRDVIDNFEEDSLIEAVANQLQRTHGFVHIDDRQLRAAVRVSANEGETEFAGFVIRRAVNQFPAIPATSAAGVRDCASITATAAMFTISCTSAPCSSTWTGWRMPMRIGPIAVAPPSLLRSLYAMLPALKLGNINTLAGSFKALNG